MREAILGANIRAAIVYVSVGGEEWCVLEKAKQSKQKVWRSWSRLRRAVSCLS